MNSFTGIIRAAKRVCMTVVCAVVMAMLFGPQVSAQVKIVNPEISYAGTPRSCVIAGIAVDGIQGYEDYILTGLSGLSIGQRIEVPGQEITEAVKRYWRHGLFSKVSISADSIIGEDVYLHIRLAIRPRVSTINYIGVKKSEREDLESKLGIMKGAQITPNMIDRAKILATKYFDDKGYNNAEINITQRDDVGNDGHVILDVDIDKHQKTKIHEIFIEGNNALTKKKIKGGMFTKGALGKLNEAGKASSFFKAKKFTPERYKEGKEKLLEKYGELGFRDAIIVSDSVSDYDEKHVNLHFVVNEGQRYYLRNISWVGNTVVTTDFLNNQLRMKKGDVYNQTKLDKRLNSDEDAIGNYYYNSGYVFFHIDPCEINIEGDSVDLEMRIFEGQQAHINRVRINGNDRLYENVVRRELRTKPGDLFSKEALERSIREIASMGHFDPEACSPDVKPDYENGTVDINYDLASKSNDQIEFSLGWGQTGVIGRISLKLNNFSMRNLFNKNAERRGIMPIGDGEQLAISAQTNGTYYQSYQVSYSAPWFGGKRPNAFNVGVFYSKQTDVSSNYYNSAYMYNYYNYYGGYGNSYYNNLDSYYDPDKYVQMMGASAGFGKRLRWPDDFFQFSAMLGYTRYMLRNWNYFLVTNGNCNNISLTFDLSRNSTDNQLFPRRGSEFTFSVSLTPPWSAFSNKNFDELNDRIHNGSSDEREQAQKDKYRWIEYHKWKFKSRTFTALTGGQKCLVLMTRVELGILGAYNNKNKSPFESFYMGGDGMSGYSTGYATETIGLRGYENGSLTYNGYGYAYDRFTAELRYPLLLGNTTIYGLGFVEAGNCWSQTRNFNPFSMKRSAGLGVRIFLPMVGLMGIDWAYGFDAPYAGSGKGGSNFHFILGQEF